MTEKKPDLTSKDRARIELAKLRALVNQEPKGHSAGRAGRAVKDLREADFLGYPHEVRVKYDSDAVAALFQSSGWSDYQMFLVAFAISVEHQGPNAAREIQKLSRADDIWARHLATSREQGGVQ